MIPDVVADVGNTRVKWGLCESDGIVGAPLSLPHDPAAWDEKRSQMRDRRFRWVVASVQPAVSDRLIEWLRGRGDEVTLLRHEHLPLKANVDEPGRVGIDRLLNAVAAKSVLEEGEPGVMVDAGSAVTVDWLDGAHVFRGGTIFPGFRLMSRALHDYTALLPQVEIDRRLILGTNTQDAIRAGVFHAVCGGVASLVNAFTAASAPRPPQVFFTGGDSELLYREQESWEKARHWPEMTLHGILVAAEGLP